MSQLAFRSYQATDKPAVVALARQLQAAEAELYDRMKPPEEIGDWYVDYLLEACRQDAGTILLATSDEAVVGYVVVLTAVSSEEEIDEIDYSYAYVKDLAVAESHRGQGLGAALMAQAETMARDAGARWLRVSVMTDNEAAGALYRKSGFKSILTTLEKPLER